METRIGIGYDIHRLVEGRKLFLGGIEIPYIKGLLGHSDGDALLHAICDALLGAMGEGDIGEHFPDTDPEYQDISSSKLLESVIGILRVKHFKVVNIDVVVIAQEPVLLPFKKQMRTKISGIMQIKESQVNIKAKTNEGFDAVGQKEAIACWVALNIAPEEAK